MVVLGGGAVSYERGPPVLVRGPSVARARFGIDVGAIAPEIALLVL